MATRKAKLWFVGLASMRSRHNMSTQAKDLLQAEFKIRERSKMSTCELQPLASISCLYTRVDFLLMRTLYMKYSQNVKSGVQMRCKST